MEENTATSSSPNTHVSQQKLMIEHGSSADRASPNVYNLWRECYVIRQAAAYQTYMSESTAWRDQKYETTPDTTTIKTFDYD
jgi:hypothetical protein